MPLSVAAVAGLLTLGFALSYSFNSLRAVVLLPLWTALIAVISAAWALYSLVGYERKLSPSYARRYGLHTLAFTTPSAWSAVLTKYQWEESSNPARPQNVNAPDNLDDRLDAIFKLIRSSFILPWYNRISPSKSFPTAVDDLIHQALSDLVERSGHVDWSNVIVSRIVPTLTDHVRHYRSVEHLSSAGGPPDTALPLPLPLDSHPALSQQAHVSGKAPLAPVEAHFRSVLERVVHGILPEKDQSEVVTTIVREVLLGTILLPVFEMMCESDFWNRQIDEKGGKYLHEQKQVNKFLSALSSLPNPASDSRQNSPANSRKIPTSTSITASSSTRQFEAFLKSIPKVRTLGEARRLRADVDREQRTAKAALDRSLHSDGSERENDMQVRKARKYVKRLERARLEVDARIAILSRSPGKPSVASAKQGNDNGPHGQASAVDLYSVLSDTSSLAYWLEFMERRFRSRLVQFWLTVESFKDPLEGIGKNASIDGTLISADHAASQSAETVHEDLSFLHQTYFVRPDQLLSIPAKHIDTIATLVASPLNQADVKRAKQAMFMCQQAVYEQMQEEDWESFKKSELFLKACSDLSKAKVTHDLSVGSPEMSTSIPIPPPLPPPLPPRKSHRVMTTLAAPQRRTMEPRPPTSPKPSMPALFGGYFSPAAPSTVSGVMFAPPDIDRRHTDLRPATSRKLSSSEGDVGGVRNSLPTTPSMSARRSSQLDFLISDKVEEVREERSKLFDEDDDEDALHEEEEDAIQAERMRAIQAALSEIIASDGLMTSQTIQPDAIKPGYVPAEAQSVSSSMIAPQKDLSTEPLGKLHSRSVDDLRDPHAKRPALASTGSSRVASLTRRLSEDTVDVSQQERHLFEDDVINEDRENAVEESIESFLQVSLPSDIDVSREIARLQDKIEELVKQEHLLDGLIRQAELTGNSAELAILNRSHASVRREQRSAIFQKAQYEQQEEESRIVPGRTMITIPSTIIASADDEGGKQVVRYTVEIKKDGDVTNGTWTVSRRYNDFWDLDKSLREWSIATGQTGLMKGVDELPPKKLVPNLSAGFIETRRLGLQRYLQSVTSSPALCQNRALSSFLSRSMAHSNAANGTSSVSALAPHNIVKSLYRTMATSLDDNLLGPNMLDLMYSTLNRQLIDLGGMMGLGTEEIAGLGTSFLPQALKTGWSKDLADSAAKAPSSESPIAPMGGESGSGSFTTPICDLFIEVFDLKENNWLRRQAIVVILQQFLGSTIERKVRDTLKTALSANSLVDTLTGFQEMMWPGGERRPASEPRTDAERSETRQRAGKKLGLLIPDVAANMIGRGNARRAARRVFGALQDKRLNQQIVLCVLDEILGALFPPTNR